MSTLSHPENDDHDFGRTVLHVGEFRNWLRKEKLHIATMPSLDAFEFVQVASLLQAIERAAFQITDDEARDIVAADPQLATNKMSSINPRWLLAAEAHRQWREVIKTAVTVRKLRLLDYVSKLPVRGAFKLPEVASRQQQAEAWRAKALAMAISIYEAKPGKKDAIAGDIAKAFKELGIVSATGKLLTAQNIARQALTPWTVPNLARENRKKA